MNRQKGRNDFHSFNSTVLEHNTGVFAITSDALILKSPCILKKHTKNNKSFGKKNIVADHAKPITRALTKALGFLLNKLNG